MPKLIHEQTGLRIVANDKNGFTVCTLRYTADSRKRTPEWREAARRGMSEAQFEQEFEIVYDSYLGAKVFPEIRTKREDIVVAQGPYLEPSPISEDWDYHRIREQEAKLKDWRTNYIEGWPKSLRMWAGFDYGANNPSSFIVFAVVDGVTWAVWELYKPCRNLFDFVAEMKACPYWDQIRYIIHDPDMCNLKQRDMKSGSVTSVRLQFEEAGIHKWVPGMTDEQAWLTKMRKHWCTDPVTFKIMARCTNMVKEFEDAVYQNISARQLETQNTPEKMVNRHNHALDACKYFMNALVSERSNIIDRPINDPKPKVLPWDWRTYTWDDNQSVTHPRRERELGLHA